MQDAVSISAQRRRRGRAGHTPGIVQLRILWAGVLQASVFRWHIFTTNAGKTNVGSKKHNLVFTLSFHGEDGFGLQQEVHDLSAEGLWDHEDVFRGAPASYQFFADGAGMDYHGPRPRKHKLFSNSERARQPGVLLMPVLGLRMAVGFVLNETTHAIDDRGRVAHRGHACRKAVSMNQVGMRGNNAGLDL